MEETLDLYSACGEPLNRTKARSLVHRDGDWHRTFHCWILYRDASGRDTLLLQKRGSEVELWPGKLDITAAGHYRSGEDIEGGLREIQEELGIKVTCDQLIFAGMRVNVDEFVPGLKNHELQDVYFLVRQQELHSYRPQQTEVDGLVEVPVLGLLQLLCHEIPQLGVSAMMLEAQKGALEFCRQETWVSTADFIPSLDHYYLRVALTAQRILRGEQYIWI